MDLESFGQSLQEMNNAFESLMQTYETNKGQGYFSQDSWSKPSISDSTGGINSDIDNALASLNSMFQQMRERQAMIFQMLAESSSQ